MRSRTSLQVLRSDDFCVDLACVHAAGKIVVLIRHPWVAVGKNTASKMRHVAGVDCSCRSPSHAEQMWADVHTNCRPCRFGDGVFHAIIVHWRAVIGREPQCGWWMPPTGQDRPIPTEVGMYCWTKKIGNAPFIGPSRLGFLLCQDNPPGVPDVNEASPDFKPSEVLKAYRMNREQRHHEPVARCARALYVATSGQLRLLHQRKSCFDQYLGQD